MPLTLLQSSDERKKKVTEYAEKYKRRAALVTTRGHEFYIIAPTRIHWHQFKDALLDPKRKRVAMENFAATHCVEPDPESVQQMFEGEPALAEVLSEKVAELAGYDDKAEMTDFSDA